MGRKDAITKRYMSDNENFADIFNYFLYDGDQVIDPKGLKEMDGTEIALPYGGKTNSSKAVQKYRDIIKAVTAKQDSNAAYLLLAIENQSNVHYAMPVRNMLYDAMQYASQVEAIANVHHRSDGGESDANDKSGEYLGGFGKTDRLIPVITLVIYWSPDKWDGPKSIHEMFDIQDKRALKHIPDYKINIISPGDIADKDFVKFQTELADALRFVKISNDKKRLTKAMAEEPADKSISRRTVQLINEVTGSKIKVPKGAEGTSMCKAIEDLQKEAADKAEKAVRKEVKAEVQAAKEKSLAESIKNLMDTMKLSAEQAMDALKVPKGQRKKYLAML